MLITIITVVSLKSEQFRNGLLLGFRLHMWHLHNVSLYYEVKDDMMDTSRRTIFNDTYAIYGFPHSENT